LLLLFCVIPFLGFGQNSYINIQLQTDNYPEETSWEVIDSVGNVVIANDSLSPQTLHDTTINLPVGEYTVNLYDTYGDGLLGYQGNPDGWFLIQNNCQDTITYISGDFGSLYTDTLIIAPCAPPAGGCLDSNATNYDPTAAFDDGSCFYPACTGLDTFYVESTCEPTGQVIVDYSWDWGGTNPNCQVVAYTRSQDEYSLGQNWYPYPSNWSNTGMVFSNSQPNTTYYFMAELADGSYTDTLEITTGDCIPGCMDSNALNWHPWATVDNGNCQYPPANCASGESNIVVMVIPDSYPGETSWEITDTLGNILQSSPVYTQTGVPILTETCIPEGTEIEFTLYDSFGDGLCGSCYGGVDGAVTVETLCGDTILEIIQGDANFGSDTTVNYTVQPCNPSVIYGCMDPMSVEYNPLATIDDGSCLTPVVLGCIDSNSTNFDPLANTMENISNCDYEFIITDGAEDGWFGSWIGLVQNGQAFGPYTMGPNDGASETFMLNLSSEHPVEILFFAPGNSSSTAEQCGFQLVGPDGDTLIAGGTNPWTDPLFQFPYRYTATPDCGNTCIPIIEGCMDSTALNYNANANVDDGTCIAIVEGCTNSLAFNFDPLANVDDGSCIATVVGCMDSTAYNYNPNANVDDGSCIYLGCTDITACNYDSNANVDNGGCIYPVQYYDCYNVCINDADADGVCDELEIVGCTDPLSINFDPNATDDDGSCIPIIYGCTDSTMFNFDPNANTDDSSCIPYVYGCTDPTMFNYDVNANTDDGSCIPIIYGCTDVTAFNYDSNANTDNGSCEPYIYGCTDTTMFNYDPLANTDNGTCEPFVYGCTDPTSFTYDPLANTNDNSCCYVGGCTDSTALNYDSDACYDDNSCITIIEGCTDVSAYNYDPTANVSDSSCLYDADCITGPGNPYWLNNQCYAWVIDVDAYCCDNAWDPICQELYNYCELGWPAGIDIEGRIHSGMIVVYPNPAKDILNISTDQPVEVTIYDLTGKVIEVEVNNKQIDLSNLSNGVYVLSIEYNGTIYNKRIIKE
jgi:hypothetical protein